MRRARASLATFGVLHQQIPMCHTSVQNKTNVRNSDKTLAWVLVSIVKAFSTADKSTTLVSKETAGSSWDNKMTQLCAKVERLEIALALAARPEAWSCGHFRVPASQLGYKSMDVQVQDCEALVIGSL